MKNSVHSTIIRSKKHIASTSTHFGCDWKLYPALQHTFLKFNYFSTCTLTWGKSSLTWHDYLITCDLCTYDSDRPQLRVKSCKYIRSYPERLRPLFHQEISRIKLWICQYILDLTYTFSTYLKLACNAVKIITRFRYFQDREWSYFKNSFEFKRYEIAAQDFEDDFCDHVRKKSSVQSLSSKNIQAIKHNSPLFWVCKIINLQACTLLKVWNG